MSRSGYVDYDDDVLALGRWRAQVMSSIRGRRGQAFLRELAAAMDAMEEKALISDELVNAEGGCCAIGVICKTRGVDVSTIDYEDPESVGNAVGIAKQLAAEIEYENDENGVECVRSGYEWRVVRETPEKRWERMRRWVDEHVTKPVESEGE